MATIPGDTNNYHHSFRFYLEIDDIRRGRFRSCSELTSAFETIEHFEGGVIIPEKSAGRLSFEDVTLERGVLTADFDLYGWHLQAGDPSKSAPAGPGIGAVGVGNNGYKRTVEIVQLDTDGTELVRWRLVNAWVKEYSTGGWDNTTDEVRVERAVLAYDYFEPV